MKISVDTAGQFWADSEIINGYILLFFSEAETRTVCGSLVRVSGWMSFSELSFSAILAVNSHSATWPDPALKNTQPSDLFHLPDFSLALPHELLG